MSVQKISEEQFSSSFKLIFIGLYLIYMLCQFQVHSKVNQLYIYIYLLFLKFFSHVDHYRVLNGVPCAIQQVFISCLFYICVLVTQACPTLCDPMDCGPLGSSVHGILQARILEWFTIPFSRGTSDLGIEPASLTLQILYYLSRQGSQ